MGIMDNKKILIGLTFIIFLLSLTLVFGATKDLCTGDEGNNTWQLVIGKYFYCPGEGTNQYCSTLSPTKRTCTIIQESELPQSTISNNYKLRIISSTYISSQINYNFIPISPTKFQVNWEWKDLGMKDKLLFESLEKINEKYKLLELDDIDKLNYLDSLKTEKLIKTCVDYKKSDLCSGGTYTQFNETHYHCNTENNYKQCDSLTSTKKTCRLSKVDANCNEFSERVETDYFLNTKPEDLLVDLKELKKGLPVKTLDRTRIDELNKSIITSSKIKLDKESLDVSLDSGSFIIDVSEAYIGEKFKIGFATTTISVTLPDNFKYINDQTPTFNFTVSGDYATYNATLKIDGVERGTSSVSNNTASSITCNTTLTSEGIYNWSIEAKWNATSVSNSTTMYFTLDVTDPVVTINYPLHNGRVRVYNPYLNFTYSETYPEKVYFQLDGEPINYTTSPYLIDNHTVLYLKMNEGVGNMTYDDSEYSNDGTMYGASFNEKDALKFDGSNDYVDCGSSSDLEAGTGDFTVEFWAKSSTVNTFVLATRSSSSGKGYDMIWGRGGILGELQFRLQGDSIKMSPVYIVSSGKWHHVVGVIDRTAETVELFTDGKSRGSTDITGIGNITNSQDLYLARRGSIYYTGISTELRIYNRSISSEEVSEHYLGIYNNETGLILHIPFTDNSGTNAEDLSGKGNNGTLINFANTTVGYGDTHDSGWTTLGKLVLGILGKGIYFDGNDDYININSDCGINSYPFTLSGWVNSNKDKGTIVSLADKDDTNIIYAIGNWQHNNITLIARNGVIIYEAESTIQMNNTGWHHVIGVFNSNTDKRLYIDGVNEANLTTSITFNSAIDRINIGRLADSSPISYMNGTIDEVRIFDIALSADEVEEEYYRGKKTHYVRLSDRGYPDIDNSTMLLMTFDQTGKTSGSANGTTERDISGNNNPGVVSGCNYSVGKFGGAMSFDGNDYIDLDILDVSYYHSEGGAWCWFGDPRAIHYNNVTYVSFVDTRGDINIWKYNHITGVNSTYTLHLFLHKDDHANPSILLREDKKLMVFYSAHNGADMYYRISTNAEDISSWGAEQTAGNDNKYTYPNPVYLSDENLTYLIYRHWLPYYMTYNESVWSEHKLLLNVSGERPYVKVASNDKDEIHFAVTDGHPRDVVNNNIYYFYYKNNSFYLPNDSSILNTSSLPLVVENISKVYDASVTGERAWIWDVALDSGDNPYIVYAVVENTSNHYYRYAWWNNTEWVNYNITEAGGYIDGVGEPHYSGGIVLDHSNVSIVYLSKEINGIFEIQKGVTSDSGATWTFTNITQDSTKKNVRPFVIRNHTSDFNVLWMYGDYTSYTNFETDIVSDKFDNITSYVANGITIEAWVKPTFTGEQRYIISEVGQFVLRTLSSSKFSGSIWGCDVTATNVYNINEWYHIVYTYNPSLNIGKLYINGDETGTSCSGDERYRPDKLTIGIRDGTNEYWKGIIDQPTIYNRALSEEEIKIKYRLSNKVHNLTAHVEDLAGNRGEDTNKFSVDFASTSIDHVTLLAGGSVAMALIWYFRRRRK